MKRKGEVCCGRVSDRLLFSGIDHIISTLLSTTPKEDLQTINPFYIDPVVQLAAHTTLHDQFSLLGHEGGSDHGGSTTAVHTHHNITNTVTMTTPHMCEVVGSHSG